MEIKLVSFVAFVIMCGIIVGACPFALIWAINGLFSLQNEYNFLNWLYAVVVIVLLRSDITGNK